MNLFFEQVSKKVICLGIVVCSGLTVCCTPLASAAPTTAAQQIIFNSFTGIYHLSRDKKGLSLLTTEETILADFPASGFTGIKRVLPETYQGHSVNIKVLNVSDAAGDPLPFKTAADSSGDLVVTTGDPSITLLGFQTIKLMYQTTGVINLSQKVDEFLLDINGKGWSQPFPKVDATLYVPTSFRASLTDAPACYFSPNDQSGAASCSISTRTTDQATVITSSATNVAANHSLVLKLHFKPATFTNAHTSSIPLIIGLFGAIFFVVTTLVLILPKFNRTISSP